MKNKLLLVCVFAIVAFIYRIVLMPIPIFGGDYIHHDRGSLEYLLKFAFSTWDSHYGLGWSTFPVLNAAPYSFIHGLVGFVFNKNVVLVERVIWWIPFFALSFFSIFKCVKYFFNNTVIFPLSFLIFLTNTYILMIISGGQLGGFGLAYALFPYVILQFIKLCNNLKSISFSQSLFFGFVLSVLLVFDMRVYYLSLCIIGIYFLTFLTSKSHVSLKKLIKPVVYLFVIPNTTVFLLHFYWILLVFKFPITSFRDQVGYTSLDAVKFLSFAQFENSISLLHPNWPENIFGKVYFMRFYFLIFPILAFSSLLFIRKEVKKIQLFVVFLCLVALISAFLAKVVNEPFSFLYGFLFQHIPGFYLFRDSSKWYIPLVFSYSILIPFVLYKIGNLLKKPHFIALVFIIVWGICIYQAFINYLPGTLTPKSMPPEYSNLKNVINAEDRFFRTLWIPSKHALSPLSEQNPSLSTHEIFSGSQSAIIRQISSEVGSKKLQDYSVKYVIVPYDSDKNIFVTDRKFDPKLQQKTVFQVSQIPWLQKRDSIGNILIFEVPDYKRLFSFEASQSGKVIFDQASPTDLELSISNLENQSLIFSETYSPYWKLYIQEKVVDSKERNGLNSFAIPVGTYSAQVLYQPQKWLEKGMIVSGFSFIALIIFLIHDKIKR